jgi:hypothetical protein
MAKMAVRDLDKQRFWRDHIAQQSGSGLGVRGYCRRQRLSESAFYFWRRELVRRGVPLSPPTAFLPVRVSSEGHRASSGRIEIVLSDGRKVRLRGPVDPRALAEVLAVLEGSLC